MAEIHSDFPFLIQYMRNSKVLKKYISTKEKYFTLTESLEIYIL